MFAPLKLVRFSKDVCNLIKIQPLLSREQNGSSSFTDVAPYSWTQISDLLGKHIPWFKASSNLNLDQVNRKSFLSECIPLAKRK